MSEPRVELHLGDCVDWLRSLPDGSVDAVVTDPPAGIKFMGKGWDSDHGGRDRWVEWLAVRMSDARRVAKPGSYALVWALPRTSHWTGWALEEAGWAIRDRVSHLFGTGFPKGKASLKPACEDWWLAWNPTKRVKPLGIDRCRIPANGESLAGGMVSARTEGWDRPWKHDPEAIAACKARLAANVEKTEALGRWPANVTHDGSDEVMEAFAALGESKSRIGKPRGSAAPGVGWGMTKTGAEYDDAGTPARFFYAAKASKADRGEDNTHPTVKNTVLMRWLCRLIAEPGDIILDPFAGSGSTLVAAIAEGMNAVGIERDPEYHAIAQRRIADARRPCVAVGKTVKPSPGQLSLFPSEDVA